MTVTAGPGLTGDTGIPGQPGVSGPTGQPGREGACLLGLKGDRGHPGNPGCLGEDRLLGTKDFVIGLPIFKSDTRLIFTPTPCPLLLGTELQGVVAEISSCDMRHPCTNMNFISSR